MSDGPIENKVANSPLITFDLQAYLPEKVAQVDLVSLVEDGVLREAAYRDAVRNIDLSALEGAVVRLHCSEDIILPAWASILLANHLGRHGIQSYWGTTELAFYKQWFTGVLNNLDYSKFKGRPVILAGCGDQRVPNAALVIAVQKLSQVAKKVMFGEACSAVPLKV